jgi:anti-anti-sigma regulatory factor
MNDSGVIGTNAGSVTLSGDLTISSIAENRARLLNILDTHEEVRITFQDITAVDLAGLQLLFSTFQTAIAVDKRLLISKPLPEPLQQAARTAGFGCLPGCSSSPEIDRFFLEGGD